MFVIVFHKSLWLPIPLIASLRATPTYSVQTMTRDAFVQSVLKAPRQKVRWGNGYGWMEAEQNLVWVGQGQRWQLICKWHVKFGIFWGDWKNTKRGNQEALWQKASPLPKESLHYICRPRNIHVGCMSFITFEIDKVSYLPEIQNVILYK